MDWLITENNKRVYLKDIPVISVEQIKKDYIGKRVIGFFGNKELENIKLYIIFADDRGGRGGRGGKLYLSSVIFSNEIKAYESLTQYFPAFHNFEREFFEEFTIEPLNHPWLKPLRQNQDKYTFFEMKGEEVHQVAVGPIHAGIIEPGHFRFMCQGEKIYDLEIMLGYQHKGVEKLLTQNNFNNRLAESICGDSVIAYNMAYSQLMETLSNIKITHRAEIIRRISLEMERIAVHIGDLGAIAGDMAFLMGASVFGVTRTLVINTMLEISGNRFGRGLIDVGGVNFDIDNELSEKISQMLNEVKTTVEKTAEIMLKNPSCISRMEKTGIVSKENALALGAVGMAARSSGVYVDSRIDFEDKWYDLEKLDFNPTGDVHARFILRYMEIKQSINAVNRFLKMLKEHEKEVLKVQTKNLEPNSFAVSITEGWRGEVVHSALTDENGNIIRYKIKDPSFNNWHLLSLAVRGNGISDFPLCNKSFNLSYCGHDL